MVLKLQEQIEMLSRINRVHYLNCTSCRLEGDTLVLCNKCKKLIEES